MAKTYDAVVAYVPVIHRGYLELFRKFCGAKNMYVLGEDLLTETNYLHKELRAIKPAEASRLIESLGFFEKVTVLDKTGLKKLNGTGTRIVLPDEDVARELARKYLPSVEVEFYPVFLRWDRQNVNAEQNNDFSISTSKADVAIMTKAYQEASKSPDTWRQVGAALVRRGTVVALASNQPLTTQNTPWAEGDPRGLFHRGESLEMSNFLHAEAGLVAESAHTGKSLVGAEIFVTTFPCPACAMLLAASGIKKLCFSEGYALLDGLRVLQEAGIEVVQIPVEPPVRPGGVNYSK